MKFNAVSLVVFDSFCLEAQVTLMKVVGVLG